MEKCLLSSGANGAGGWLTRLLKEAGYRLLLESDFGAALERLKERPALWLCDAQLLRDRELTVLVEAERRCRQHEVFGLVFTTGSPSVAEIKRLVPWVAVMTVLPGGKDEVLARVHDQLSIRRLAYERNQAQARLLEKQSDYRANLESAALIQRSLLPQQLPELQGWEFAAHFIPCEATGGDLYNVLQLSEETVMVYLLDVSGHGVSSAMVTVSVYQSLSLQTGRIVKQRTLEPPYYRIPPPTEVLDCLDREFPFERFEKFFTICYLLLDVRTGTVRYGSAGHPPPLVVRADGSCRELTAGGGIIGLDLGARDGDGEVRLRRGDRLYLYSDGVIEHMNEAGELYGGEKLARRLQEQRPRSLADACRKVVDSLYDYSHKHPPRDDITLLGIEYRGE